tara:strand:+ start:11376 stop:11756 length:381 start_codon:yes stop_codon:yes gene_type:complete
MASDFDYDFSELDGEEKKTSPEITRPDFKITKCCGNCKFFWYYKGNQRKGNCKLPDPKAKQINKKKGESYYNKKTKEEWDKVHVTNVCGFHQYRNWSRSLKDVGKYCGVTFDASGLAIEEDNDDTL